MTRDAERAASDRVPTGSGGGGAGHGARRCLRGAHGARRDALTSATPAIHTVGVHGERQRYGGRSGGRDAALGRQRMAASGRDGRGAGVGGRRRGGPAAAAARLQRMRRARAAAARRRAGGTPAAARPPSAAAATPPPRARLRRRRARPLLPADVLRVVPRARLGRLDRRAGGLLRELLPRRVLAAAQLPLADGGGGAPGAGRVLRPHAVLGALAHLLRCRLEHHQARPARDGGRGVRLPVAGAPPRPAPSSLPPLSDHISSVSFINDILDLCNVMFLAFGRLYPK